MEVLKFMNEHEDWEDIITQSPYNIKVKRDGDYILLKYNQLSSDFSLPIVRECRGSIFYLNNDGMYECVCRAFDKFGNYGESYVPEIDWDSAVVEEKVDGSLIKVWYHNGNWHVSTNGTIDAYKAEVDDAGLTFGALFDEAIANKPMSLFRDLNKDLAYMFELVSPKSRATISYPETKLYTLGFRDMKTMQEDKIYDSEVMCMAGVAYPKIFPLHTLEDCLSYVKTMTKDEEGFVIRDANFNRIKLKSPEYLIAFHLNNNGAITTKRIINMMKDEMLDDFLAYRPEYHDQVQNVIDIITGISQEMDAKWNEYYMKHYDNRGAFAAAVQNEQYKSFLFVKLNHPQLSGMDYIMNRPTKQIRNMIERNNNGN